MPASPSLDFRLNPHYPAVTPLDAVISKVETGHDEFITEKHAEAIEAALGQWGEALLRTPPAVDAIRNLLAPTFQAASFHASRRKALRPAGTLEVFRNSFASDLSISAVVFLRQVAESLASLERFLAAEFEVTSIKVMGESPLRIHTLIRYDLLGSGSNLHREGRVGYWEIEWEASAEGDFRARTWRVLEETLSRSSSPIFTDITAPAFGNIASYQEQMVPGTDYWRTVLDSASGINIYGNNGLAVGDIDNDGFDDFYICQPAGLPNLLYRNRGDGTFEDVTESAGVGVLDGTACALFADLGNRGFQDLVVVRLSGPLLFRNQGNGKFKLAPEAFKFAHPPEGTFTSAALADYDGDGRLDIYFCLYSYYQGLDAYQFPTPYYAAENGPPNFLLHNNGDGTFSDVTAATGLMQNNHRFSFACAWGDYNNDGWPDLYVANDFGKKNLYRNNGNGTFTDVAEEVGVLDVGPGMSVCWFDSNNDGNLDLYVANMWTAPGLRVSMQDNFMKGAPAEIRSYFHNHAMGNALYQNDGQGKFLDRSQAAGGGDGRWSWSCTSWDVDCDGYPDIYIPNGFISEPITRDLESFFWRQVVSRSPLAAHTTETYERGWNAINELIRSDYTWAGYERNILYLNNRDGTFSDVSGAMELDFREDCRSFALADFDHDGRPEVVLKSRNSPQLRILHNDMPDLGNAVSFRLRGHQSNRDAIGAAVMVKAGWGAQRKFVQAGLGFSTEHSRELFFGLGQDRGPLRATVRWPSGAVQEFDNLPVNSRILVEEGNDRFTAQPFTSPARVPGGPVIARKDDGPPAFGTWLLDPLLAPDFSLPDLSGTVHRLQDLRGHRLLLNFWATSAPACQDELVSLERHHPEWSRQGLRLLAINVNPPDEADKVRAFVRRRNLSFPVLLADDRWTAVYNLIYRYLYDRRRDLGIPTSFLIDEQGLIARVYQGPIDPAAVLGHANRIPRSTEQRIQKGLPFRGDYYGEGFSRNVLTYGVAFYHRGFLDEAISYFEYALRNTPEFAAAYYDLGAIFLQKKMPEEARRNFLRALEIRPGYADCLNNLGLLSAQEGKTDEAVRYFQEAVRRNPDYTLALVNLGILYRREERLDDARDTLEQGLRVKGDDPDLNYNLGMVFAQQNDQEKAQDHLEKALKSRPDYPEALNNLGVLFMMQGKPREALAEFEQCIRVAPQFDRPYLNLAKLYFQSGQKQKAREILRALLAEHPDHPEAKKYLEQLGE